MRFLLPFFALVGVARAGDPPRPIPPASLLGTASFEWARGKACKLVDAAQVKKWTKAYTCMPPDDPNASASGRPVRAECKAKHSRSAYLVFGSMADCNEERDTQLANE